MADYFSDFDSTVVKNLIGKFGNGQHEDENKYLKISQVKRANHIIMKKGLLRNAPNVKLSDPRT
jgi:hypothetical protein